MLFFVLQALAFMSDATNVMRDISREIDAYELESMLSGPYDDCGCTMSLQAGES
jgi:hypothetical protein